jgi:hypothetical protein
MLGVGHRNKAKAQNCGECGPKRATLGFPVITRESG